MTNAIIGAGGGGKGGGGSARAPVEDKDSLRSKAYANVLDLVSEGEIEGLVDGLKSIYLDGTPIQNADGSYNFQGVEVASRVGSQMQAYVPGFPAIENSVQVATEVKKDVPVVRQITNANLDAVRVTIAIPQLTYQDTSNGDLKGTEVQYAIDVQSNGGGYVPQVLGQAWTTDGLTTIATAHFRSTDATARGLVIAVPSSITNDTYRMEYRLVGSPTWLTAGVSFAYAGGNKMFDTLISVAVAGITGNSYLKGNKFTTPTLDAGQWEARIVAISGGAAPPTVDASGQAMVYLSSKLTGTPYETVKGKTTSRYQRSHLIRLTGSPPWDIRVRRITADSTQVNLQNDTWWDAYTEVIEAKLRYPNSALVGIKIDASQFQAIPTRGYDLKMLRVKVPSNYNPTTRVYTGAWDGTFKVSWTDNPAWCFYDLVTNDRYGLGGLVSEAQVDKWALYQIGKYCDELVPDGFGGTEPRFTCNFYLQTRAAAYKVLQDFASIFRGMVFWATGSITATQDAPSDPVALFTAANVIGGKFTYSGSALRARHTVALVTWNDPEDLFRQKVEYVEDSEGIIRYGVNQTEVVAVGCTSRGQANRVGRWLLYSERSETESVTFSVGAQGAAVRPGNIIKISDSNRASARLGGRVSSATTSSIIADQPISLTTGTWTLYCTLPNGTVESRQVQSTTGSQINLISPLTTAPLAQSVWILSATTVEAQTFRVVAISENDDGSYAISALKHEPSKFAAIEQGLTLETRDYTLLNNAPPAPTGLTVGESLYAYQAEVRARLTLSWQGSLGASKYYIDWLKDDGNFVRVETPSTSYDLMDITPGVYLFRVYAANPAGLVSPYAQISVTALGKTAPPADVTNIASAVDKDIGVTLTWDKVTDLDVDAYEVRQGTVWETATLIGQVKATVYSIGYIPAGNQTYLVKALDTSGSYSTNAASITVNLTPPSSVTLTQEVIDNNVLLRWSESTASLSIRHYRVKRGSTWATATEIGTVAGRFSAIFENAAGTFTYWVTAVDLAGNEGTPTPVTAQVGQPPDYQLKLNLDSTFTGTKNNMAPVDGGYLVPADTTETWQSHFTSRSWTTPQDQINAGFPVYAMPAATSGYYEELVDYGTVLASTKVSATISYVTAAGTVTVTPTISVRKLATDPWTNYAGMSSVFVTDFRYVKVRFDFTGVGGDDFVTVTGLNIKMDAKLKNDAGTATANSADSGGTTVNFNVSFVDIESITVTPLGTSARIAVYDFVDVPNPTSFKVLLFDTAGNRVSGTVSWSAKGV